MEHDTTTEKDGDRQADLFKQHFEDTWGHPIQHGNLEFTVRNGYGKK